MTLLIAGLVLFLGVHAAQWPKGVRAGAVAKLGLGPWKGLYALASIAGFALIIIGFGEARATAGMPILYDAPTWGKHLSLVLMPIAFILFASSYAPTGRIKATVKHPQLLSVKVWAFAHLLANGDLPSVLLFGAFLAWAVGTRISSARREKAGLANPPIAGGNALVGDLMAIVIGLAASAAFIFWLHPMWIGVPVWPGG